MKKPQTIAIAPAEDRLLRIVPEVTQLTGFSRSKVYRLIDDGALPVVRIGGSVRVRYQSLLAWMRQHETPAA